MALTDLKELAESLKGQFERIEHNLKKNLEEQERHAEQLKRLGGDVVEGDATLAEQVNAQRKAMEDLRRLTDQYVRQLPALMSSKDGERDPEYVGFWPNAKRAQQFGFLAIAASHPNGNVRRTCAEHVAKAGLTLRNKNGHFVKGDDFIKAMGEGTDTAGGYLVPDEFVATIIRNVSQYGVARARLRKVPMRELVQTWPKRTGGLTVYYPDEGVAATVSNLSFGTVTLTAKKWAVYSLFSRELEEDSAVALGELIAMEIGLALAIAEDTNCFNGDGTSTYCGITGVMQSANVAVLTMDSTKTTFASIQIKDLTNLIATAPDWVSKMPDAAFYMHPAVWAHLQSAAITAGIVLYQGLAAGIPPTIAGFPVILSNVLPYTTGVSTKFIIFGSLYAWGFLGQRRGMVLERSNEVKWLEDQVAIKCVPRQDIVEADGTALAVLKTAAS